MINGGVLLAAVARLRLRCRTEARSRNAREDRRDHGARSRHRPGPRWAKGSDFLGQFASGITDSTH